MNRDELIRLWNEPLRLFRLANLLREKSCGDVASFVINRNINFTNRCVGNCKFCAFRRREGYLLSHEEILERAAGAELLGATEICLQGGLAPGMAVEDYCEILEIVHSHFPRMHLHAYSPMEVLHMSRNSRIAPESSLIELKGAGLCSMPGTAAEILVDAVRERICPEKLSTDEWRRIITAAHMLRIPTTSTMLYGHVESMTDRLDHIQVLRELQAKTHGFTEFVLLPFMPANNPLGNMAAERLEILDHLKMHAWARISLHPQITNIQASWVKLGREVASATLDWGANDLGGTLIEENISRSAGATEAEYISAEELCDLIERHGKKAVQRTTLYGRVE
jgi:FO synthase subunit 2